MAKLRFILFEDDGTELGQKDVKVPDPDVIQPGTVIKVAQSYFWKQSALAGEYSFTNIISTRETLMKQLEKAVEILEMVTDRDDNGYRRITKQSIAAAQSVAFSLQVDLTDMKAAIVEARMINNYFDKDE